MSRRAGGVLVFGAAVLAALAVGVGLLRDDDEGGSTPLLDGTPARSAPTVLGLGSEAALARARLFPAGPRGTDAESCLRLAGVRDPARAPLLEVVGLHGRSLTFYVAGRKSIAACDASARAVEARAGPWCGVAHGRLFGGRLRDGRLDMVNCRDEDGRPVAFGWIEPVAGAHWLAVQDGDTVEVYPVVRGYPLRLTTKEVDVGTSSAVFDVTQFAADGRRLADDSVEMRVAG